MRKIENLQKKFKDGSYLNYGKGKFDDWCVYLNDKAITDKECFEKLKYLANEYDPKKVYNDFVCIYDITNNILEEKIFDKISKIAKTYKEDKLLADKIFSILYMTMIAEENKQNTILGKRIKRLGVHMVIREDISPNDSANYTKGVKASKIDKLCKERGF